jgi:hypothetical protein
VKVKPKLKITQPLDGGKFTYSNATPGLLNINCLASINPASYGPDIEWSMTNISGSNLQPGDHKGLQTSFDYKNLPPDNNQFGEKMIIAALPSHKIADTVIVKIYFPKDATNNPGNNHDPNWYYYWKQAISGTWNCVYGGNDCKPKDNGYFKHDHYTSEGFFHICPNAAKSSSIDLSGSTYYFEGIDNLGQALIHEDFHLRSWQIWWGSNNYNPTVDDFDGDYIPNDVELNMRPPTNPADEYSLDPVKREFSDWEVLAFSYCIGSWRIGSSDNKDWANPGHQY